MREIFSGRSFEQLEEVMSGGLAFVAGVGGNDDLLHLLLIDALQQLPNADVIGPDGVEGGQHPLQNVIASLEGPGLFDGQEIGRALDHTELSRLPAGVGADGAELTIREMKAARTGAHALPHFPDPLGQLLGVLPRALQEVHGNARGALFAQAGKFAQPANEVRQNRGIGVHGCSDLLLKKPRNLEPGNIQAAGELAHFAGRHLLGLSQAHR